MNRHSRNIEKKGWCDSKHRDVREWFRTRCNSDRHQNVETVPSILSHSARYEKMIHNNFFSKIHHVKIYIRIVVNHKKFYYLIKYVTVDGDAYVNFKMICKHARIPKLIVTLCQIFFFFLYRIILSLMLKTGGGPIHGSNQNSLGTTAYHKMLHQSPKYAECNGHHLSSSTCPWRRWVRAPTFWVIAWYSNSKSGARHGRLLVETVRCLRVTPAWWTVSVWVAGSHVAAAVVAGDRVIPQDTTMRRSFWSTMHTTTLHSNQTVYPLSEVRYDTTHLLLPWAFYFNAIWITQQCTYLMFAIPKCLTHIQIYNDVSVKHNKTLFCLLLY